MTATNHAATGAVIALAVQQPFIVIPLALASHFALDVLPHHGLPFDKRPLHQSISRDKVVDMIMLPITGVMLLLLAGAAWWLVLLAMVISISPDFVWVYRYFSEKKGEVQNHNRFTHWHSKLQWAERPWGWIVELIWFAFIIGVVLQSVVAKL